MRRLLFPLILVLALVVGVSPAAAKTRNVKIGDDFFVRNSGVPTVTVKKGTTVKWNWTGHDQHNVTVSKGPFCPRSAISGTRSSLRSTSDGVSNRLSRKPWRRRGSCDQHNVSVQKGPVHFQSPLKSSGSFKKKMKKKGTYTIICTIHQPDMRMKLKVK